MVIRVEHGRGRRSLCHALPRLLEILRTWWPVDKPSRGSSGDRVGNHITKDSVQQACQKAHQRCGISKPITPHSSGMHLQFICWNRAPTCALFNCYLVIVAWLPRPLFTHRHEQSVLHYQPSRSATAASGRWSRNPFTQYSSLDMDRPKLRWRMCPHGEAYRQNMALRFECTAPCHDRDRGLPDCCSRRPSGAV
jgi:hypothetical protein